MQAVKSCRGGGDLEACILALETGLGGKPGVYMLSHKSSDDDDDDEEWMLAFSPLLCRKGACMLAFKPGLVGEGGE